MLARLAVGSHLLVGGDNMDLTLAHLVAGQFAEQGVKLDPWQSVSLWHSCRTAKETLLSGDGPDTHTISVLGRGSKLIGGTVSVQVDRKQVSELLVDGFLPRCRLDDVPQRQRASGFQQLGLPFESDTGITRHVASFLSTQAGENTKICPSHVLFNGGVFKSEALQSRLLEVLNDWQEGGESTDRLPGVRDLDHAVAIGARRIMGGRNSTVAFGFAVVSLDRITWVSKPPGWRFRAPPRPLNALCVVPFGMEEGTQIDVPSSEIGLVHGEQAQFRFFSSSVRKTDQPGDLLQHWDDAELTETDPLLATLPADDSVDEPYVPVTFQSRITELGVFQLWCVSVHSDERWKLEFSVRDEGDRQDVEDGGVG